MSEPNELTDAEREAIIQKGIEIRKAWGDRAGELAAWALKQVFVRTDRFGGYYLDDNGTKQTVTRPGKSTPDAVNPKILESHFRATHISQVIGAHALTPQGQASVGRWVGVDIDAHDETADKDRNQRYTEHLYAKLTALGFRVLAVTWATGGFHVWIFFSEDLPGVRLYSFAKWIVSDSKTEPWNYREDIETFPKQAAVAEGKCGNWLRVPGRHHTRPRFARVFNGTEWVVGEPAVAYILGCTGDDPMLIPAEAQQNARSSKSAKMQVTDPKGDDVFAEFNRRTALGDVVRLHETHGHRVINAGPDRVEFIRDGKDGSGQSFNVAERDGCAITYSFSTNAGMPPNEGLTPSQIRCLYEFGKCDKPTMARFADKLRDELGMQRRKPPVMTWGASTVSPSAEEPAPFVPRPWNDPARLAETFLKENVVMFVKETAFVYEDGRYYPTGNGTVEDRCWTLAEREALREYHRLLALYEAGETEEDEPPTVPQVTIALVNNMVRAVRSETRFPDETLPGVWLREPLFDGPPLCVANGILNLQSLELHPHAPELFTLTKVPVAFDPNAAKPEKFLRLVAELSCHDHDWCALLQEIFGACLDTSLPWKHFTALVGQGDNGKTVVLNVLRALLGAGNHSAQTLSHLTGNQFGTFPLFGKLANIVGDESGFDLIKEGRLKELTGGECVAFEQKNKTPFFGPNLAKLVFGCNVLPEFLDRTEGVWNRLIIMPFDFVVPESQKDPDMLTPEFWADELSGILNWALEGLRRVRGGCITRLDRSQQAVAEHRVQSNPALRFLTECYRAATTEENEIFTSAKGLFEHYAVWLKAEGYDLKKHMLNTITFGKQVQKAFPNAKRDVERVGRVIRVWRDVRRATPEEELGVERPSETAASSSVTPENLYAAAP